ncbi:bifunctional diguanylate cyclase/phosphodiesterase [Plantactinospora sp. KBS50]|uniref:putative bifunctional diguanylate cyclase/phosphodiesterase n=1 Tax=Plantactinospora sp. KBS50 TaxID=2024580 RepID=UPI000BAAB114|nr:bifunctional diguanylate cyclase/phosphodiesterase [Plantactinospora sp. KBS50]ASW55857.1 GGDEF-domain containing protein [Plantactinospora sp. KBS50]
MSGIAGPAALASRFGRISLWLALGLGTAVLLTETAWLVLRLPDAATASDAAATLVAGIAAGCCLAVSRRHPANLRRFWLLMALTMALAATGRIIWTVTRLTTGGGLPNNLAVALVFVAGIVSGTAALLSCVSAPPTAAGRLRTLLDGVIVGLALVPVSWVVVLRDVAAAPLAETPRTLGLFYPMFDVMQLTILVAISGPLRPVWRPLSTIGAGLAIRAVADTVYVAQIARGTYEAGHPIDVCWPLSYLLVAVATRYPAPGGIDPAGGAETEPDADPPIVPWWRLALPYLPVCGAAVAMVLARQPGQPLPPPVFLAGTGLLVALAIRQSLTAYETTNLADRLRRLAYVDQLTGLPNRLQFTRRLRRCIRERRPVAVLLLDLDGFKQVNDRFGHASGDTLLTNVASRMRAVVGGSGMIARIGGDEFAVLLETGDDPGPARPAGPDRETDPGPGRTAERDPDRLARRLLAALGPGGPKADWLLHSSASIGIAEYGPQHQGHTDLLRDADIAMYAAKAAGKSAYRTCTPRLREAAVGRAELIADLRRAVLEAEQLELEFQPIVELGTGTVRGAEALVRWRHPRHGLLAPDRFLPLAEETGLILTVDRWVIRAACRAAAGWQLLSPGTTVAVNVAAGHLRRADLTETVAEATAAAGLPPESLTLELTETALIEGTEAVLDRLGQLRDLGVRIALDDFGTGYSALNYLHRIPATELKIDRSFVRRLDGSDQRAYATVEMIRRLAGAFGLGVVAEGVETDAQHAAVAEIGCPHGQGYRYGRPRPLPDLHRLLVAQRPG